MVSFVIIEEISSILLFQRTSQQSLCEAGDLQVKSNIGNSVQERYFK